MIRIGWPVFATGLLVAAAALVSSSIRSYRMVWRRPAEATMVRTGRIQDRSGGGAHAHHWWLAIRRVEYFLDSLRKDSAGVRVYDSVISRRPGFMDSLRQAEKFFYLEDQLKE